MQKRCSALFYWLLAIVPVVTMTGIAIAVLKLAPNFQFADWWKYTIPKLLPMTVLPAVVGTTIGVLWGKVLTQYSISFTAKEGLGFPLGTLILATCNLLFVSIAGTLRTWATLFFVGYAATVLLLALVLWLSISCIKGR